MPTQVVALLPLLDKALAEGRLDEAQALAQRLLADEDSHFDGIVGRMRCALAAGDPATALRWAQRAHRYNADDLGTRTIYAAMLLQAGRAQSVPSLLEQAEQAASPLPSIVLGRALLRLGRLEALCAVLGRLLQRFPPSLVVSAAELADEVLRIRAAGGWAAADLDGRLVGGLASTVAGGAMIRIHVAGEERLCVDVQAFRQRFGSDDSSGRFSVPLTDVAGVPVNADIDGAPLMGMPARTRLHPAVEGVVEAVAGRIDGWAWCPMDPSRRIPVRLIDETGRSVTVTPDRPVADAFQFGIEDGPFAFSVDAVAVGLHPGLIWVHTAIGATPLLGSPLRLGNDRRSLSVVAIPERSGIVVTPAPAVDIVIPVYGARDETLACLDSVFASLTEAAAPPHEVVVIDDAGPDPVLADSLATLAGQGRITFLRNERNLGFPGTVNRALALHPERDVVLLNADTLVSGDWLARLRAAVYSRPDAFSATPLSNDATILTYPSGRTKDPSHPAPTLDDTRTLDAVIRAANHEERVEIPTAVGFCVYLRRDGLRETGPLDAVSFGRGYGEENDLCLRARALGWRHLAALDVFVAHVGGRSFGRAKTLLTARNGRILERLHPGYGTLVRQFLHADPLMTARRRADLARWHDAAERPSVLLITLTGRGGVTRFVDERIRAAAAEGRRVLTLAPDPFPDEEIRRAERRAQPLAAQDAAGRGLGVDDGGITGRSRLSVSDRPDLRDLVFRTAEDFDDLLVVLRTARVTAVEIHHVLGHASCVVAIPELLRVPYDLFIHDYSLVCPRISFVDGSGRYCGEPGLNACERCTADPTTRFDPALPATALRRRSRALVAAARRIVVATPGTAARLLRLLDMPPHIVPMAVDPWEAALPVPSPPASHPVRRKRIVVVGAIGRQKGYDVLLACAHDAAARDLPLEFVVVGFSDNDARLVATGRVFVTGRFTEAEAVDVVRAEDGDLAFLPSITPETWCYTLSTVWKAGLRAVAFDLGAIAERIRDNGGGWLLPPDLEPSAINEKLLSFLDDSAHAGVVSASKLVLSSSRKIADRIDGETISPDQDQFSKGASLMTGPLPTAENTVSSPIRATTQLLSLPPGFYALCVLDGGSAPIAGQLPLPSIQLGALPVPAAGSGVEFLGSLPGNWLTKVGDVAVIRVYGAQNGCVILTSFKHVDRPNDSLRLQFSRIDDGTVASAPAIPAAPPRPQARAELLLHISRVGDRRYPDSAWAGTLGQRQPIEAFAVVPAEHITAEEIEYKGLTANGWETAWLVGGSLCGSRGMGTPLIGFSVRLKGAAADRFDCVYEGAFTSGQRTAPAANGAPCRSDVIGDPLEGILLRFVPKAAPAPRVI